MALRFIIALAFSLVMGASYAQSSAAGESKDKLRQQAQQLMVGPSGGPPTSNITSFAQPLRCMDGLFRTFPTRPAK
jgi:hypothetical protein